MKTTKKQADAVRSYLAGIGHNISHVQALEVIARGQGLRSRHVLAAAGATPSAGPIACHKCDSTLDAQGYCSDAACPYYDWPQIVLLLDMETLSRQAIESKYGIVKHGVKGEVPVEYRIRRKYESAIGEHPNYPVSEWLWTPEQQRSQQTYWAWVVTRLESIESDELLEPNSQELANAILAEYLKSRCHADDVDHAVGRLMKECPALFSDDRKAWEFINDETHEDNEREEGSNFLVIVASDVYGEEVFTYYTEEEQRAGLVRLMSKAADLDDGVGREYFKATISDALEKDTAEYDDAISDARVLAGQITAEGEVSFDAQAIGTISELKADGLTLHSWIDDNP